MEKRKPYDLTGCPPRGKHGLQGDDMPNRSRHPHGEVHVGRRSAHRALP